MFFHKKQNDRSRRRKRRHTPQKLQTKLFCYNLIAPCVALLAFTVFFWYLASTVLLRQARQSLATLNSSFLEQADASLRELDYVSATINYVNIRKNASAQDMQGAQHGLSAEDLPELSSLYAIINSTSLRADQINIYDGEGNVIRIGRITKYEKLDPDELEFYGETQSRNGSILIGAPALTGRYAAGSGRPDWYLSVYRSYFANRRSRNAGVTECARRCSRIFRSIISYTNRESDPASVYIYREDGSLIYPYDLPQEEKSRIETALQSAAFQDATGAVARDPLGGGRVRYAREVSSYSGWTCLTVQKENVILAPFYRMLWILAALTAGLLCVMLFLTWQVSRSMVRPVKHLKHIIQRLGIDNLGVEKTDDYNPSYEELGELYAEYQKMSEKLKTSMDALLESRQQELNSRVSALQAQINPHFYYNTLSCISILAESGRSEEVEQLCLVLAQCMRYISDNSTALVSLGTEMEYIKKYLYCMKVRYQDSLQYDIEIDPSLLEEQIPRLIIQPLVENAITHGTDCLPPWRLCVRGRRCGEGWIIEIRDSGNGFTKEALAALRQKIEEAEGRTGLPELRIGGMGIVNTSLRWKLSCGERAIFRFGNTEDGHAYVQIGRT